MNKGFKIEQPPHGYVMYVDHLGSDQRIVEAARVSYDAPSKGDEQDKKLLNYLFKNRHTSPFEQCSITFEMKFPIFVMRQFVRHRTFRLNEVSARYTQLPEEFFLPKFWRAKPTTGNKQGSTITIKKEPDMWDRQCSHIATEAYQSAYLAYQELCASGVANEMARFVLPVGIYTKIYVNIDLHNLIHFLKLRLDSHAQSEMQEVAQAMKDIAAKLFPWTFEAYDEKISS